MAIKQLCSWFRAAHEAIKRPWYLIGPSFVLAIFFWSHYKMGLTQLPCNLAYPDVVCISGSVFLVAFLSISRFINLDRQFLRLIIFGAVSGLASMFCIILPGIFSLERSVFLLVSAILFAFFLISSTLLWLSLLKNQSIMLTMVYVLCSVILGYGISWFMLDLDVIRTAWALSGSTILTALFLLRGLRKSPVEPSSFGTAAEAPHAQVKKRPAGRIPAGFACISFAFSASYMYITMVNGLEVYHSVFTWDIIITALLLLALGLLVQKRLTLAGLFSLAAPLMIVGLLLTLFIDMDTAFLFGLFHMGYFVYLLFILILYCGCLQELNINPFALASLLVLSVFIGFSAGRLLYPALIALFSSSAHLYLPFVSIAVIVLLILCTLYGLHCIYQIFGSSAHPPRFNALGTESGQGMDSGQIAQRYGLSEREREVLELLLEGKSATQIAGDMVVAHGTIKAHIRNIYKKLGIHQREELFALTAGSRLDS